MYRISAWYTYIYIYNTCLRHFGSRSKASVASSSFRFPPTRNHGGVEHRAQWALMHVGGEPHKPAGPDFYTAASPLRASFSK